MDDLGAGLAALNDPEQVSRMLRAPLPSKALYATEHDPSAVGADLGNLVTQMLGLPVPPELPVESFPLSPNVVDIRDPINKRVDDFMYRDMMSPQRRVDHGFQDLGLGGAEAALPPPATDALRLQDALRGLRP